MLIRAECWNLATSDHFIHLITPTGQNNIGMGKMKDGKGVGTKVSYTEVRQLLTTY